MNIQQLLLILRARSRVILYTLLACFSITLVVNLILPKQYTAITAVVIDVKSPDPIAGLVLPGMISPSYMATQIDIINSDRVAQRVVKLLRLEDSQAIREQWQEATGGKGQLFIWLAHLLQQNLDVRPSMQSNLININYTGIDPAFSAAVANAFAQAYIDVNLELKVEPARQSTVWFEGQTKILRDKLEAAQTALSGYQQKTGIVASDERLDFETAKLNELSTQLTVVQAQTSDSHSKSQSAGSSDTLPEVMQNSLILGLKADIARLEARQQDNNVNLGANHPQTQRAASELASLRTKLNTEMRQISHSLGTSFQVGRQKEKELLAALESQKARVLDLNRQRDEISVLKRDVESAQRAFELVGQRSTLTRLESQSIQTNVVMLSPASAPDEYSRPRIFLNLLISVLFGTLLGMALALTRELANRPIRSPDDLAQASGLSILARIPPSKERKAPTYRFLTRSKPPKTALSPAT
jgi:chain length determinant protein EpsF